MTAIPEAKRPKALPLLRCCAAWLSAMSASVSGLKVFAVNENSTMTAMRIGKVGA